MEAEISVIVISSLYSFTGVIRIVSYAAQFRALWLDQSGAQSTSLVTWGGFLVVWLVGGIYGWVVISDPPVVFVSVCGAVGSGLILGLAAWRRFEARSATVGASTEMHVGDQRPSVPQGAT